MKFKEFMKMKHLGAGIVFLTDDFKTLLLQKKNKKWSFPGGHAIAGETPLETAHRECKEETQHTCTEKILGELKFIKDKKYIYSFFVKAEKVFKPTISDEHIAYSWHDIRTIPAEYMTSVFAKNWKKYKKFVQSILK